MYNNASYRQYNVSGGPTSPSVLPALGATVREQPAIMAWTGATVNQIEPDPGKRWYLVHGLQSDEPQHRRLAL